MDRKLLYASPFTDIAPSGPERAFSIERIDLLVDTIERLNASAVG